MKGSFLDHYAGRKLDDLAAVDSPVDAAEDLGCLGYLRGVRERAVMLELRKRNGHVLAVGYGWLERMEYEPSDGITLSLGGRSIRIKGRNLNAELRPGIRLFEGLTRHRVGWIQEAERSDEMQADAKRVIIQQIEW